jgi:hypothetical protein
MASTLCFNDDSLKLAGWKYEVLQNLTLAYDKDTTQNENCFEAADVLNAFVRQVGEYILSCIPVFILFDILDKTSLLQVNEYTMYY